MRFRTVAVTFALLTGCSAFTTGEAPVADAGAGDSSSADASAVDASGDAGDPPGVPLPSPQDCLERGMSVLDERFDALPAEDWSEVDPQDLLVLDPDAEDVVSPPTSFRASTVPQVSGDTSGLIQRILQQSFTETICVTFQGRLLVQGMFSTGRDHAVTIASAELGASNDFASKAGVALVVDQEGLRLRVQNRDAPPIAYGNDVDFQRWTIVIGRAARKVAFWIGPNNVTLPLDMPFTPKAASFAFGIDAKGQVPVVLFHMDDLRVSVVP